MHADTLCDLKALESDLCAEQVTIRYRDGSELKEVETGRAFCGNSQAEIVLRPYLTVWSQCRCSHCVEVEKAVGQPSETTSITIPVWDIVDVEVKDWATEPPFEDGSCGSFLTLSRWLRSRFGQLKRLALDD